MEASLTPLLPLLQRERAADRAFALAVVVATEGSTYRKPGALLLVSASGEYAGLLSGGCLEGDLREHALRVIETGKAHIVSYDLQGDDQALWGLGVGCEGAMSILVLRVGPENEWQPLDHFKAALQRHERAAAAIVVESNRADLLAGSVLVPSSARLPGYFAARPGAVAMVEELLEQTAMGDQVRWLELTSGNTGQWADLRGLEDGGVRLLAIPLALPPRILLLGAGPDAMPVCDLASRLGWKATVADHRPAYAKADHFPGAERVVCSPADELTAAVDFTAYDAAVIMSHHLGADLSYLRALSASSVPYVGLLGPPARRERLLSDLGAHAASTLGTRLRAPVGLALGGRAPESIALAIVAEIHAFLHGKRTGYE